MQNKEENKYIDKNENLKYYFTTHEHAISNIEKYRIKLSMFNSLNDIHELVAYNFDSSEDIFRIFSEVKDTISSNTGFISFSKSWKSSIMWGHYSSNYTGICLGYKLSGSAIKNLSPIDYIKEKKQLPFTIFDIMNNNINEITLERSYKSIMNAKSELWKYEQEERLMLQLKAKDISNGLYFAETYKEIILREIIIGANSNFNPLDIAYFLESIKYKYEIKIFKSKASLNTFDMERKFYKDYDMILYTPNVGCKKLKGPNTVYTIKDSNGKELILEKKN